MERALHDLRYALRALRGSPGFTAVAIATLALGIGVNSTIFSLVNAVLLRPIQGVERPDELVNVYGHTARSDSHDSISYPNYLDYRERAETVSGLAAVSNFFANLAQEGRSELIVGELVSDNYFDVLGVQPAMGREFVPEEYASPEASAVVVIGHELWRTRFASDPDVLGRTLRLNGVVCTIVGVAPPRFGGMFPGVSSQMWLPIPMALEVEPLGNQRSSGTSVGDNRLEWRGSSWLWLKGRRAPGVNIEQVRAELESIAVGLAAEYPETNEFERITVIASNEVAINPDFDGALRPAGLLLLGVVGLVLLVACANLANMMLARVSARRREVAIRLAIGAHRGALIRQILTESLMLALLGGAGGLMLASWLSGLIVRFQPPLPIDVALDISPDWRVLAFTLVAAALTGVVFGLVPALRASRPDLVAALKDTGAAEGPGRRLGLRDALVVVQVAVSIVLLVAGTLMIRSLIAGHRVDPGYDLDNTAFLALAMEMNGYDAEGSGVFLEEGRGRLAALPEVESVGLTSRVPLSVNNNGFGIYIDGHQESPADRPYIMDGARIDETYFESLGLRIVSGRGIEVADRLENRRVAVVTQTMAARYWPGESPIGREFRTRWDAQPTRIVGVVEDHKVDTPGEGPKPYIYLPLSMSPVFGNYMVRTSRPAGEVLPVLEAELRVIDPDIVFLDVGTLRDLAEVRLFPIRAAAWLIGAFGALALALAAIGLYGVIGYSVSRRVREIGIRMALGAEAGRVHALVLRQGMALVAIGGVIGVALGAALAQLLSSVLFVSAFDPVSFGVALLVLGSVALFANWVPARRASRVDPMIALRTS